MEPIHSLAYTTLIDLLDMYTKKYTQMSRDQTTDPVEYVDCERMVLNLQDEIERRRRQIDRDYNYFRN